MVCRRLSENNNCFKRGRTPFQVKSNKPTHDRARLHRTIPSGRNGAARHNKVSYLPTCALWRKRAAAVLSRRRSMMRASRAGQSLSSESAALPGGDEVGIPRCGPRVRLNLADESESPDSNLKVEHERCRDQRYRVFQMRYLLPAMGYLRLAAFVPTSKERMRCRWKKIYSLEIRVTPNPLRVRNFDASSRNVPSNVRQLSASNLSHTRVKQVLDIMTPHAPLPSSTTTTETGRTVSMSEILDMLNVLEISWLQIFWSTPTPCTFRAFCTRMSGNASHAFFGCWWLPKLTSA